MSSTVPNIPILGFATPLVKSDQVWISARLGSRLYNLQASAEVWRELLAALDPIVGKQSSANRKSAGLVRPGTISSLPKGWGVRDEAYRALWLRYISSPRLTITKLAREAGVTRAAVSHRFATFRKEPGAPALRPNGKL